MTLYTEDKLLMLSGIQHLVFCERQWALIHIEQEWIENHLTLEGHYLHERVDDPFKTSKGRGAVALRSVHVVSYGLGLYGIADLVELKPTDSLINSIKNPRYKGYWHPVPVEYKRGKPKPDERDEVQLCAQAMCLEEMHAIHISSGYLYYGETHHRHEVLFEEILREKVIVYAKRMHELFDMRCTPIPVYKRHCKSCSLYNICLPKSMQQDFSVNNYLNLHLKQ